MHKLFSRYSVVKQPENYALNPYGPGDIHVKTVIVIPVTPWLLDCMKQVSVVPLPPRLDLLVIRGLWRAMEQYLVTSLTYV